MAVGTAAATTPAWKPQNLRRPVIGHDLSWREITTFLSPTGQQRIVEFVRQSRNERGPGWLNELQSESLTYNWISELVRTMDADEAFEELQAEYPTLPLAMVKPQVYNLHSALRDEIERG